MRAKFPIYTEDEFLISIGINILFFMKMSIFHPYDIIYQNLNCLLFIHLSFDNI